MKLTAEEEKVVGEFKKQVFETYPGEIEKIILYGSKARGDATHESDIDLIVVTRDEDWRKADAIRSIGYSLDDGIGNKLSIQALSLKHMNYLNKNRFHFSENIRREGVTL